MNGFAAILQQAKARAAHGLRGVLTDLLLAGAILLSLGIAAGYGLSALHQALRHMVGPVEASALIASGLLVVAMGLGWILSRRHRPSVLPAPPPLADPATPLPVADPGLTAAFLAGFLLARRV